MCWGEWGAAPPWHRKASKGRPSGSGCLVCMHWAGTFLAEFCSGVGSGRCWGSQGSLVLLNCSLTGMAAVGSVSGRGKVGVVGVGNPPWDLMTHHGMRSPLRHLGMTGAFHSALGEEAVWSPCWEAPGVKDQAVGNLCSSSTAYLKAMARGSTSSFS